MSVLTGKRLWSIVAAIIIAIIAVVGAGHIYHKAGRQPPEKLTLAVFQPLPLVRALALQQAVQREVPQFLSTTLPIQVGEKPNIPFKSLSIEAEPSDVTRDRRMYVAGNMHTDMQIVPAKSAYLVKYTNSQLCDEYGACPIALFASANNPNIPDQLVATFQAKSVQISNQSFQGNPDLIVDYGLPSLPPIRMYWEADGTYPSYQPYPPSATKPLRP